MKVRILVVLVAVAMLFALVSASYAAKGNRKRQAKAEQAATATAPATAAAAPVNKFCAVEQDNPVDPKCATVTYKGKVIGFCCPDCIEPFQKNPEKYMEKLK